MKVHSRKKSVYTRNTTVPSSPGFGQNSFRPPFTGEEIIDNIDLYVVLAYRPFTSLKRAQTLAYISTIDTNGQTYRPLTGLIVCSMQKSKYNLRVEDENTPDNFFFWKIVHDFIKILGFHKDHIQNYHPQDSQTPYSSPTCTITTSYKTYKFLITPNAHKFAVRHFGVETFTIDGKTCKSGIELEESVDSEYGILEGRTLFADVMSNVYPYYLYPRVTDATAAVLLDTGNYEINWSMVQPHEWGHRDSINGKYIKNFATGNPQDVYPRYYAINFDPQAGMDGEKVTGFNFKFTGYISGDIIQSSAYIENSGDKARLANGMSYFNPKNWPSVHKLATADFAAIKPVKKFCPPKTAVLPSEGGPDNFNVYVCGEYNCETYNEFNFRLYNNSHKTEYVELTCNNQNANVKFEHTVDGVKYKMWCVEPERFCRSMMLHEAHFNGNPFDDDYMYDQDLVPFATTIPPTPTLEPTPAPSPVATPAHTPSPSPSLWPTDRPPELWPDPPDQEIFPTPEPSMSPVPMETPMPTDYPEQTDYPEIKLEEDDPANIDVGNFSSKIYTMEKLMLLHMVF